MMTGNSGKKLFTVLFATLTMMLSLCLVICASAETDSILVFAQNTSDTYSPKIGLSNIDAIEGYIQREMYFETEGKHSRNRMNSRILRNKLQDSEAVLYDKLKMAIQEVAAGSRSSTEFTYPLNEIVSKTSYTADELGFSEITQENAQNVVDALSARVSINFNKVLDSLIGDCPYDLYWYDKTLNTDFGIKGMISINASEKIVFYQETSVVYMNFVVAKEYSQSNSVGTFTVDTAKGQAVQNAVTNAKAIINENKGKSDLQKMQAYKDKICELVSYNNGAASDSSMAYGNPWQLVWVFDGDTSTNVVCEGYSKAFQYLCDLTLFNGSVSVMSVSGMMSGGTGAGPHMWNLVRIGSGKSYLVDVTNCDKDTVGYPNYLFLAGYASGNEATGNYTYDCGGESINYQYYSSTISLYSTAELTMSNTAYSESSTPILPTGTCGADLQWKLDQEGCLTIQGSGTMLDSGATILWDGHETEIKKVVLGDAVTSIGAGAFSGCTALTEMIIPASVTTIGDGAFTGCSALTVTLGSCTDQAYDGVVASGVAWQLSVPHSLSAHSANAATCTAAGNNAYWSCGTCGRFFSDADGKNAIAENSWAIDALGHQTTVTAETAATCTTVGNKTYWTCGTCHKVFKDQAGTEEYAENEWVVDALGHSMTETVASAATCTTAGNQAYWTCGTCHKVFKDQAGTEEYAENEWVIEALGHSTSETAATLATCTTDGNQAYWTCGTCHKVFKDQAGTEEYAENEWVIDATGHTLNPTEAKNATCTTDGNSAYWTCEKCGKFFSDEKGITEISKDTWIIKAAHKLTETTANVPTCTSDGNIAYWTCEACGKFFSDDAGGKEIAQGSWIQTKLEHSWGKVSYEWSSDNSRVTATRICSRDQSHQETEDGTITEKVTKEPTEKATGMKTLTATFKNTAFTTQTKEVTIPKLDPKASPTNTKKEDATPTPGPTNTNEGGKETPGPTNTDEGGKGTPGPTNTDEGGKETPGPTNTDEGGKETPGPTNTNEGGKETPGPTNTNEGGKETPGPTSTNDDNKETPAPSDAPVDPDQPVPAGDNLYKVDAKKKTAAYTGPKSKKAEEVVIPDTIEVNGKTCKVTAIADGAFRGMTQMKKVTLGKNIKTIGNNAFSGCTKLATVSGGNAVTSIGNNAFQKCTSLTSFKIGSKVKTIGNDAFNGCKKLKKVTGGGAVTDIGTAAFKGCSALTAFTIGSKVKTIGAKAFYGCKSLVTLTIKSKNLNKKLNGKDAIGTYAFKGVPAKATVKCGSMLKTYKPLLIKKGVPKKATFKK